MRVLLTTDGSPGAAAAAHTACRILRGDDRQIELVCIAPKYLPRMTGWDESRTSSLYKQTILAETGRILGDAESVLASEGIHLRKRVDQAFFPSLSTSSMCTGLPRVRGRTALRNEAPSRRDRISTSSTAEDCVLPLFGAPPAS